MKKIFNVSVVILCSVIFTHLWTVPVYAYEDLIAHSISVDVEAYAAVTGWRYKTVDGKLYKRLYDYTNQKWIGEWELCP